MGAMGRALAGALVDAGYTTTVWNRSPGRAVALADRGARVAGTIDGAVSASPLVIACLLDHASVHEVLDPVARRLTGMYLLFAGFIHGAAMVGSVGVSATEFASRAGPFLAAMTGGLGEFAKVIDGGDYTVAGQQSLEFSDLADLLQASVDQGVSSDVIEPVQRLIRRQIAASHGSEGLARIYEEIRSRAS